MHAPEQPYTLLVEIVATAVVDQVADEEVDEQTHARSTNAHTAKWTINPPKHAERESMLKSIETSRGTLSGNDSSSPGVD